MHLAFQFVGYTPVVKDRGARKCSKNLLVQVAACIRHSASFGGQYSIGSGEFHVLCLGSTASTKGFVVNVLPLLHHSPPQSYCFRGGYAWIICVVASLGY